MLNPGKIYFDLLMRKTIRISSIVVSMSRPVLYGFALFLMMVFAAGCGRMIIHYSRPLVDDINKSFMQQQDIKLAEQGIPAFLLILDGLIKHSPEDKTLLLSGAKAYSAYTAAFVGDNDPERNRILAKKAREYAFRAFSLHDNNFAKAKDKPYSEFVTYLNSLGEKDVPYLFYVATCWAGWIQANSESWDAIADLPKVQSLIERVIELDEGFNYGASHTFMGVMLTLRPPSLGGRPEEARKHFERAIELGQGRFLPTYVMYAKHYAKLVYREKLFHDLLDKVLASPVDEVPDLILINTLAQRQARDLIGEARKEEYFN
jgi:tetratricopeptide (TPR) repeat protein